TLNFRATLYFRNSRNGEEANIGRQYSASFKKVSGRWQADRNDQDFASLMGLSGIPGWIFSAPHPLMLSDTPSDHPPGGDEFQDHAAVSMVLRELADAIQRHDTQVLERLLAEDYVGRFGNDLTNYFDKARQIAMAVMGGSSAEQADFKNLCINPCGAGET